MKDFINKNWLPILKANNLETFEKLWEIKAEWFEPPNKRRGGWSGVSKLELNHPDGGKVAIFLKRQENHIYKPLRNLIKGAPTFRREMTNINRFNRYDIAIPEPIFYAERTINKQMRAVLITASIAPAYRSLEDWCLEWQKTGFPSYADKQAIIKAIAAAVRKMHKCYLKHGALVSKHIFINYVPGQAVGVRFIDLEKTRYWFLPFKGVSGDLKALAKSLDLIRNIDLYKFYKHYIGNSKFNKNNTAMMRQIAMKLKINKEK